jgi:hypothetical protein
MQVLENPLRLEIMKRLCGILREITPANGYVSDFSGEEDTEDNKVFRGRAVFGEGDPLPMLSVLESPIPLEQLPSPIDSGYNAGGWEIMIQGFLDDDKTNPTDPAYVALADVRKRIAIESKKVSAMREEDGPLGLLDQVTKITTGIGTVRPPDEVSAKAYFWLLIVLEIVEDVTDPYTV